MNFPEPDGDQTSILTYTRDAIDVDPRREPLPIGHKLDREKYEIIEIISQKGGFSFVYLAKNLKDDQHYAIKEYFPQQAARGAHHDVVCHDSERQLGKKRLLREMAILINIRHKNIVPFVDFFEQHETIYLVMSYVQGETLDGFIHTLRSQQFPEQEKIKNYFTTLLHHMSRENREDFLLRLFYEILTGIREIHSKNILHLDLKPQNIIVTKVDGKYIPVIIDFGTSRYYTDQPTETAFHSLGYSPPEVYTSSKEKNYDPRDDIYSLGCVLYWAVSGKVPVSSKKRMESMNAGEADPLTSISELCRDDYSQKFLTAIDHALLFDKSARPENMDQWLDQFPWPKEIGHKPITRFHLFNTATMVVAASSVTLLAVLGVNRAVEYYSGRAEIDFETNRADKTEVHIKRIHKGKEESYGKISVPGRKSLPQGKYAITFSKNCFKPIDQGFEVTKGGSNQVLIHFEQSCGDLSVTSNIKGAEIHIDDQNTSKKTPGEFPELAVREVKVNLVKECYDDHGGKVAHIKPGDNSLEIPMDYTCGTIKINGNMPEATVVINGINRGTVKDNPSLETRSGQQIVLAVKQDCHSTFQKTFKLQPKETKSFDVRMDYVCSDFTINSIPPDAKVFIDGTYHGNTKLDPVRVQPGPHELTMSRKCFKDKTARVDFARSSPAIVWDLEKSCRKVPIRSKPEGASVVLTLRDGSEIKGKTPFYTPELEIGSYKLTLSREGFHTIHDSIQISSAPSSDPDPYDLESLVKLATVKIISTPPGATIKINNKKVGTTPYTFNEPRGSRVTVTLYKDNYYESTGSLDIREDEQETSIEVILEPKSGMIWKEERIGIPMVWISEKDTGLPGFWIGQYEITQEQYRRVVGKNSSKHRGYLLNNELQNGERLPVESVSYQEAEHFVARLNQLTSGNYSFGLPEGSQWMAACLLANPNLDGRIESLSSIATIYANSKVDFGEWGTRPAGYHMAKGLQIYDLIGNVYEFVTSDGHDMAKIKGGSFKSAANTLNCHDFSKIPNDKGENYVGIRIVRSR